MEMGVGGTGRESRTEKFPYVLNQRETPACSDFLNFARLKLVLMIARKIFVDIS